MAAPIITPDSSVLIAGFAPEHPFYEAAASSLSAVRKRGGLIAHTMAETFSVLTGQAYGHPPANVLGYLDQFLERAPAALSPLSYFQALRKLTESGVVGGAIYDGLIAATAAEAGLRLISLDRRAVRTYAALNADYEILT